MGPGRPKSAEVTKEKRREWRYAASELVAIFEDGREERSIVRRSSTRRKIREFEVIPGLKSVSVVRRLSLDEWEAFRAESPGRQARTFIPTPIPRSETTLFASHDQTRASRRKRSGSPLWDDATLAALSERLATLPARFWTNGQDEVVELVEAETGRKFEIIVRGPID